MITSRFPLGDVSFTSGYFATLVGEAAKQCYGVAAMAPRDMTDAVQGFHTIGALKTNRLLYPSGMKKKLSELAAELSVTHKNFDLVTVKGRNSSLTPTMSTLPA